MLRRTFETAGRRIKTPPARSSQSERIPLITMFEARAWTEAEIPIMPKESATSNTDQTTRAYLSRLAAVLLREPPERLTPVAHHGRYIFSKRVHPYLRITLLYDITDAECLREDRSRKLRKRATSCLRFSLSCCSLRSAKLSVM